MGASQQQYRPPRPERIGAPPQIGGQRGGGLNLQQMPPQTVAAPGMQTPQPIGGGLVPIQPVGQPPFGGGFQTETVPPVTGDPTDWRAAALSQFPFEGYAPGGAAQPLGGVPQPQQQPLESLPPQQQGGLFPQLPQERRGRRGGGGGGAGGYQSVLENLSQYAGPSAYEQQVLGGQFLGENPYQERMGSAITQQFDEQMQRSLSQLASPFAGAGGTMGFTGINAATRGRALDESGQNLSNSLANLYGGLYEGERGRMNEIAGFQSGRGQSMIGAGASAYGSQQAAQTARANARLQARTQRQGIRAGTYGQELANALGYSQLGANLGLSLEDLRQRETLIGQQGALQYLQGIGGTLGQYGTQSRQGPQTSVSGAKLQGGVGGGLTGAGIERQFRPGAGGKFG